MAPITAKLTKNQQRRAKKKAQKQNVSRRHIGSSAKIDRRQKQDTPEIEPEAPSETTNGKPTTNGSSDKRLAREQEQEYNFDDVETGDESDPLLDMYKGIMDKFEEGDEDDPASKEPEKPEVFYDEDDDIPDEDAEVTVTKLSKKKRKQMTQMSVAELKALVKNPETVEWTDTSASDPRLLVSIKAHRNIVPVPAHWSLKREYLSSKRGVEKPAFSLPKFIQETGIAEMRDAVLEKQDQASLKQKQRERVQPKMGKLDIDYQKLYEAFFRFQTKPELTRYGEVYYEGKEYETNLRHLRPGELSDDLKDALNIPLGAPPPWLINQQRFGPPPSYPALRIPGLNAAIPPGASWGFQPGQWGKPPVDEATNRPLYGGDFHNIFQTLQKPPRGEPIDKDLWGELQAPEEESEEEEEEESGDEEDEEAASGIQTSAGVETPSGMVSSVPSEFPVAETVSEFDLRKRRGTETEESTQPQSAYQVIPEHQTRVQGFFGGDRGYDLKNTRTDVPILGQEDSRKRKKPGDVDVSMDPESLQSHDGIDKGNLQTLYDQQRKAEENPNWAFQEDLSDMIASESRKRLKKNEEKRGKK